MKKILVILIFIGTIFVFSSDNFAYAENTYYARILKENVFLYKDTSGTKLFELHPTYFVELIGETGNYYKVKYDFLNDVYVKKEEVSCITGIPQNKYPELTLSIISTEGGVVRESPNTSAKVIDTIGIYKTVKQFGSTIGNEQVASMGNKWYYVTFTKDKETINGYVYGGLCYDITEVSLNTESHTYVDSISLKQLSSVSKLENQKNLITFIVLGTSVLVFSLLFLPKIVSKHQTEKSTKTMYIKSSFDDDEF